jgi:hypothetical protein
VITADPGDVTAAEAADAGSAKTSHVTAAEAADMASAKAAHVAAAKATTVTAATAAAAGLRARGNETAGKQRTSQNHHQSCFHDLSPLGWADIPPQDRRQVPACFSKTEAEVAMGSRWAFLSVVSTKFAFNHLRLNTPPQSNEKRARKIDAGAVSDVQAAAGASGKLNSFLVEKAAPFRDVYSP